MNNVIDMVVQTTLDVPVDKVMKGAIEADLAVGLVLGYREDGSIYFATSTPDAGEMLMLIEQVKLAIIQS